MSDELNQRVLRVIATSKRIPLETVTIDSDFQQLTIDSMDAVEILFAMENEFDISIPDAKRPELVRFSPSASWPKVGDSIDVLDLTASWYTCTVVEYKYREVLEPRMFWVHYNGWGERWDEVPRCTFIHTR